MRKIKKIPLATAILYLSAKAELHPGTSMYNKQLADLMTDSELSDMEQRNKVSNEHSFMTAFVKVPYFRVRCQPWSIDVHFPGLLDDEDVRIAAFAVIHQKPRQELREEGVVECVFVENALMAVRNYKAMLSESGSEIRTIKIRPIRVPSPVPSPKAIDELIQANIEAIRKRLSENLT